MAYALRFVCERTLRYLVEEAILKEPFIIAFSPLPMI